MKKLFVLLTCIVLLAGCAKQADSRERNYEPGYSYEESDNVYKVTSNDASPVASQQKYVFSGRISIETKNYDDYVNEFNSILARYMGVMQAYNESGSGEGSQRRWLNLTVRIPSENFDKFISDLRASSGSVVSVATEVDNITKAYNDNEIEIEALEAQHARLLELLKNADSVSEIIEIEDRLTDVETRLTKLKNYRNSMDADVAYSTIHITIEEVMTYTENSFWQRIKDAFAGSFENFVYGAQDFVIGLIYAIPTIVILALLVIVLRKPVGKFLANRRERKHAAKTAVEKSE